MLIEENKDLTGFNAYRVRSTCRLAYSPETELELVSLLKDKPVNDFIVIGNGNNILLAKEYYDSPFIILNGCLNTAEVDNDVIVAEAGATLLDISNLAQKNSLSGLEEFYDIPSSVGGAVVMNAGNKNAEIKDVLIKVRYLDINTGEVKEASKEELDFSYRNSLFQNNANLLVLKAWFKLIKGNPKEIRDQMESAKQLRWEKQPREYPNCGSVFKRPKGRFVGPMLDELGLKGFTIGGAQVSEKHSGFIINIGGATGKDVLAVIDEVKIRVKSHFDVDLEVEQRIVN